MPSLFAAFFFRLSQGGRPFAVVLTILVLAAAAQADRVRISSATRFVGLTVHEQGEWLVVKGMLEDDASLPLDGERLNVSPLGPLAGTLIDCTGRGADPSGLQLYSDELGRFCLKVERAGLGATLRVRYPGSDLRAASEARVVLQPRPQQVKLAFSAPELQVVLGSEPIVIRVDTVASDPNAVVRPIPVSLWRMAAQGRVQLAETTVAPLGQTAVFTLNASELGAPGISEIYARFAGDEESGPDETTAHLTALGTVRLQLAGEVAMTSDPRGWQLSILASSPLGSVPEGVLELRNGAASMGASPLQQGKAQLLVAEEALRQSSAIEVWYVPAEPWWQGEGPLPITLPALPVPTTRPTPLAVGALLLVAFLVWRTWQSPLPKLIARAAREAATRPGGEPQMIVLGGDPASGWSGQVVDAHDGRPLPGATVEVRATSFHPDAPPLRATTDAEGRFSVPALENPAKGATLSVSATEHRGMGRHLDGPATLLVQLVQRRRALISELVKWHDGQLLPNTSRSGTDPTPGQIAVSASQRGQAAAGMWARGVEQAAFSEVAVDEQRDEDLMKGRPGPSQGS